MVNVELGRQEAEEMIDVALKALSIRDEYFLRGACVSLILACGMRKTEEAAELMISESIAKCAA